MKKVLILEDEVSIRSFVVINLKRAGYEAIEAGTGREALERLKENPDTGVAILDIMLRLPLTKRRKAGTTSNHHAPYVPGYTRNTMAVNRGKQSREAEQTPKSRPSSDCRLQLACMKSESLVIADQHAAVNTFPGLVHTARHTMRVGNTRSP